MKRRLLYASLSSALLLGLLYSCMREEFGSGESGRSGMLIIADARRHFERTYSATKSGGDRSVEPALTPGDFTPSWSNSTTVFDGLACVNTPILPEYSYEAVWHLPDRDHRVKVFQKYITVREPGSTLTDSYIMTLVPCGMFPRGVGDLGDRFQNCGDTDGFTGLAIYYHQGLSVPIRIDVYLDGEIKMGEDLFSARNDTELNDRLKTMSDMMSGITFCRYNVPSVETRGIGEWFRELWDNIKDLVKDAINAVLGDEGDENGDDGDMNGNIGYPTLNYGDVMAVLEIRPVQVVAMAYNSIDDRPAVNFFYSSSVYTGGGAGSGGSSGGGSGGGSSSDNSWRLPSIAPYINYNPDIQSWLYDLLQMMQNGCLGKQLNDELKRKDIPLGVDRSADPEEYRSTYNFDTEEVSLSQHAGSVAVFHEFYHHAQYTEYGDNMDLKRRVVFNNECEVAIAEYRFARQTGSNLIRGKSMEEWKKSRIGQAAAKAEMMLDKNGNLKKGCTEEEFNKAFREVGDALRSDNTYNDGSYPPLMKRSMDENLSTFKRLLKQPC